MILSFDHSNDQLLKFWLMPVQITVFLSKKKTSIPLYQIDMTYIYSWFIESGDFWRLENRKTGAEVSVYESWLQNSNRWLCRTWFAGVFGLLILCFGTECEFHESQATQGDNYCQLPAHRLNDFSFLECGKREGRSYNYINTLRTQINTSDIQRVLCKRVKKVFSSY